MEHICENIYDIQIRNAAGIRDWYYTNVIPNDNMAQKYGA